MVTATIATWLIGQSLPLVSFSTAKTQGCVPISYGWNSGLRPVRLILNGLMDQDHVPGLCSHILILSIRLYEYVSGLRFCIGATFPTVDSHSGRLPWENLLI